MELEDESDDRDDDTSKMTVPLTMMDDDMNRNMVHPANAHNNNNNNSSSHHYPPPPKIPNHGGRWCTSTPLAAKRFVNFEKMYTTYTGRTKACPAQVQ